MSFQRLDWYGARSVKAANDLRRLVRQKLSEAAQSPRHWPLRRDGTREIHLKPFSYSLVFRELTGAIEVLAFAHTSRRPGYWRNRLD
jgi:toxin ParE1/3/4